MRRRKLLHATAAALTAALAGCSDDSTTQSTATAGGTETPARTETPTQSSSTPAVVTPIAELWTAYSNGNADGVVAAFHPNAPNPPEASTLTLQGTVTVDETTVRSRSTEGATVGATLTRTTASGVETQDQTYELRPYEGEWRIWAIETESTESSGSDAPQVVFASEYATAATSDPGTGVVTITHEGGDSVDAERLSVRGDGIVLAADAEPAVTVSGTNWANATGEQTVAAGSDVTVGASSDCEIRVVWESADGETAAVLSQYSGPDA